MKKTIILGMSLIVCALCCVAQWAGWYKYPIYHGKIDQVLETSDKLYFRSGSSLFSYSYDDNEMLAYTSLNKLSDNQISSIYYNGEGRYMLIAYDNCNIDLLYDDGEIVNLPEIKDSPASTGHTINDVDFGNNRIAIATSFGIVVYNEERREVIESGIYGQNIELIAIANDKLIIYGKIKDSDQHRSVCIAPLDMRHNSLDKFKFLSNTYYSQMLGLDNSLFYVERSNGELRKCTINADDSWSDHKALGQYPNQPMTKGDGRIDFSVRRGAVRVTANDVLTQVYPEELQGYKSAFGDDMTKFWIADVDGVARYQISGEAINMLNDKMLPAEATTCEQIGYMKWSPDHKRLYLSNMSVSLYRSYAPGERANQCQTTNILCDSYPYEASLMEASADSKTSIKHQTNNNDTRMYGDPNWIIEDPDNPDRYYIGSNLEGVYVAEYNEQTGMYDEVGKYTFNNSLIPNVYNESRVQNINIDPAGNLWVGFIALETPNYAMLPADKRRLDPKQIQASDWKLATALKPYDFAQKDMMSLFCKSSTMAFIISGTYGGSMIAMDTKGTYDDPSDDTALFWNNFTDQDGLSFSPLRITFLLEDNRGAVWVGTSSGIFEITNPKDASSLGMTVRRIKVPRNDGTNYADYLLDSDQVNWMCLDPAGRKWVATETSGIFLVSETGDEIIKNYTVDNSPLPSNTVCSIECDAQNNTVYVGTPIGLYTFLSDASAPQDDYSDVLAYPNPVRPEFSGDVTISGLMDNSIVKIADSAGNVICETRSQGGMATWNVCNNLGKRVRSGVYYVYVSSNNDSSTKGAVTKILVIN